MNPAGMFLYSNHGQQVNYRPPCARIPDPQPPSKILLPYGHTPFLSQDRRQQGQIGAVLVGFTRLLHLRQQFGRDQLQIVKIKMIRGISQKITEREGMGTPIMALDHSLVWQGLARQEVDR